MELINSFTIEQTMKTKIATLLIIASSLLMGPFAYAQGNEKVDALLTRSSAPEGVVFEIVSGDEDTLERAIPAVQRYSEALRKKFPGLAIAVVSHGNEQFSLTKDNRNEYADVHKGVKSLVNDKNISVHICETYAGWQGVSAEDFPDYIDVAAAGPVQINDYKALGYELVVVNGDK
jgi:intracellular sulfur oxidation DsrE/DsrF family protein